MVVAQIENLMKTEASYLASMFSKAHNAMRNIDGLHPAESFDELLKYLIYKSLSEYHAGRIDDRNVKDNHLGTNTTPYQIRGRLREYLSAKHIDTNSNFVSREINLTDECLGKVHEILGELNLSTFSCDIRSAATRAFLQPNMRKGLGIFLTPEEVVRETIEFFDLRNDILVADPASGSGTFLLEMKQRLDVLGYQYKLVGLDKNPRMTLLAELNLWSTLGGSICLYTCDSLRYPEYRDLLVKHSVDLVVTNPPFGVEIDSGSYELQDYDVTIGLSKRKQFRLPSEMLFLERCIQLLKADGYLGIVLPRSVLTTSSFAKRCTVLGKHAAVRAILTLPPETFAVTGTMTNTIVLFVQKYGSNLSKFSIIRPVIARISDVGYDATGRKSEKSDLMGIGRILREAVFEDRVSERVTIGDQMEAHDSFKDVGDLIRGLKWKRKIAVIAKLNDYVEHVITGVTPPRENYSDIKGLFLVKVGNLTGGGINWIPRARNYIDDEATISRRYSSDKLSLQTGDVLLTSSAHSPKYIGKKCDIVTTIPDWIGDRASFVGEVMLIRPDQSKIDPYLLLAYLRIPSVVRQLQLMIRGQTAHLYPRDVLDLPLDLAALTSNARITKLIESLKEECQLNDRIMELKRSNVELLSDLSDQISFS